MVKTLKDLTAQEILALAIQSEEEDGRIYAFMPTWRSESAGIIPPRRSRCRRCATRRTAIGIG
jgi:hypothetical protein